MSAKHTPGPWQVSEIDAAGNPSEHYIFIEPGVAVIERKVAGSDESDLPDARLIAAAPELLAFAQEFLGDYQSLEGMASLKYYAGKAHAAIAKATGGAA